MTTLRLVGDATAHDARIKSSTTPTLPNDANKNIFANKRTCKYEIVELVTTSYT